MFKTLRGDKILKAEELDEQKIKAINDSTRLKILEILGKEPRYPAEIAEQLGLEKQKVYYHIEVLETAGLIEKDHEEKKSGGLASFHTTTSDSLVYDFGKEGEKVSFGQEENVKKFLRPLLKSAELKGSIVVGSPDQHGPDQVRARDGHLAGEIGMKLGEYAKNPGKSVMLDTETFSKDKFGENLLILGGVLTNTVAKKFNEEFAVEFEGEEFPYRKIRTPEGKYNEPGIGFIAKTGNPENPDKALYIVAGVRNKGTTAAVEAFKDLENIIDDYSGGNYYCVVKGLDMDGDGEIDDYELVEEN